jgi:hypothetical protein
MAIADVDVLNALGIADVDAANALVTGIVEASPRGSLFGAVYDDALVYGSSCSCSSIC